MAVRILYLLTLFYMHIFHLHREGQLSVIETILKYNRNVLTVFSGELKCDTVDLEIRECLVVIETHRKHDMKY